MISKIKLKSFRLFDSLDLDVSSPLVILSGKNATGKTSILEALYLCSTGKSHRTNDLSTLIRKDDPFSIVEVIGDKQFKYVISKDSKSLFINKNEIKKISDFVGNLPEVLYSPDDISLIKGSKLDKEEDKMLKNMLMVVPEEKNVVEKITRMFKRAMWKMQQKAKKKVDNKEVIELPQNNIDIALHDEEYEKIEKKKKDDKSQESDEDVEEKLEDKFGEEFVDTDESKKEDKVTDEKKDENK